MNELFESSYLSIMSEKCVEYRKEIDRLNIIINEIEKFLIEDNYKNEDVWCITTQEVLNKLKELKNGGKSE